MVLFESPVASGGPCRGCSRGKKYCRSGGCIGAWGMLKASWVATRWLIHTPQSGWLWPQWPAKICTPRCVFWQDWGALRHVAGPTKVRPSHRFSSGPLGGLTKKIVCASAAVGHSHCRKHPFWGWFTSLWDCFEKKGAHSLARGVPKKSHAFVGLWVA